MPNSPVIEIENLRKFYKGKHRGVDGVDLEVREGEVFGFLGPNGAGKTTTIRILLDLIRADSGSARVFGLDTRRKSKEVRRRVGYLPGEMGFYENVIAREMVDYFGALCGSTDTQIVKNLTDRLEIDLSRRIREYSKGNKQKLGILMAFLFDPELVILDEPTSGLDSLLQKEFYEFLTEESANGRTVFMSSHVLSEVERVCDRVGIIREGKIVAVERIETLKKKMGQIVTVELDEDFCMASLEIPVSPTFPWMDGGCRSMLGRTMMVYSKHCPNIGSPSSSRRHAHLRISLWSITTTMTTIPNNLAVFLWTFQRKWKGLVVFLVSVAMLVFVMVSVYPTVVELRGELMAEAFGGEIRILLTQDDAKSGDYTLEWDVYAGADGYVVVTSDTEIPLPLVKSMASAQANLRLMAVLLPGSGKHSLEILDATSPPRS